MFNAKKLAILLLTIGAVTGACFAQTDKAKSEEQKFYRLDFVVKEVGDSKVINSRSYSTVISTGDRGCQIRTGNRVPYNAGNTSQYLDVGVNIDCRKAKEIDNQLALNIAVEVSNLAPEQTAGNGPLPVLRQDKWSSDVILSVRKPTEIFSSDDPTSTHKLQVELTATPIK